MADLETIGPPPYARTADDVTKSKYAGALTTAAQLALASLDPSVMASMKTPPPDANYVPRGVALDDIRTVSMAAYDALREETVHFDARRLGMEFGGGHSAYFLRDTFLALLLEHVRPDSIAEAKCIQNGCGAHL